MPTNSVLTKTYPSLAAVCHATAKAAPSGLDAKTVAQFMGKPYQTLMSELSRQEGHKFGADLLLPLMDVAGSDAPLHFLARERGGVYVSLPAAPHSDHPVHQQCMKTVAEFGLLMEETAEAMLSHFTLEMRYQGCASSLAPRNHKRNFVALLSGEVSVSLPLKCVAFQR